jgi:2-hydroxy-6-oxonona-2,4-dienedioate hydrolase
MADTMPTARQAFVDAQRRMLDRYQVEPQSRFVDVASISGQAQVLVCGDGPAVVMLNGIGVPAAMWAPLMAELEGLRLFVVDLPGYGLTDTTAEFSQHLRRNAVRFLEDVLDGLELTRPGFLANSLGGLWAGWLALDRPDKVAALVYVGCPALALGTSAPFPMRLLSVRPLGRLMTRLQPPSPKQVEQLSRMVKQYPLVPELVDLLVATERLPGFRSTFLAMLHGLLHLRGARPEVRLTPEQLAAIDQPTLIFWGDEEPFGARNVAERMAATMPTAELHIVRGGHAPWLTDAQRIAPIATQFLQAQI